MGFVGGLLIRLPFFCFFKTRLAPSQNLIVTVNLRFFIPLVGVLLLFFGTAWAQETKEAEEGKEAKSVPSISLEGYLPIQLRPITVLVKSPDGRLGRGTISMFLIVRGKNNVAVFCRYLPRVREAITLTVDRSPVPVVNGRYQLKNTQGLLHKAINQVLPRPLVVKLHLLPVPRMIGKGAVDLELPGTSENCMSIQEIPADVLAMLKAENQKIHKPTIAQSASRTTKAKKSVTLNLEPISRPPRSKYTPPSVTVQARKSDIQMEETPGPRKCKKLNELWSPGFHQASGRQYWLGQAFTLDDNNDDVVDNVGFLLKSEERPDVYIYYFPGQGLQSVITVPSLRIANDRDAKMVCAGQEEFSKPKDAPSSPRKMAEIAENAKGPISENGVLKVGKGGKGKPNSNSEIFDGPGLYLVIAAGIGVLLIVLAGIYFFITRGKSERRRKERRHRKGSQSQNRRERQEPPEGEDQRISEDRRVASERRHADESRKEEATEEPDTEEKGE